MKMGAKGLESRMVIMIAAVIVVIVLIYLILTRGIGSLIPWADKSMCISEILDACSGLREWETVNKNCATFFADIRDNCGGCITSDTCNFENCCTWVMGQKR